MKMKFKGVNLIYNAKNCLTLKTMKQLKKVLTNNEYAKLTLLNKSSKLCFYLGTSNLDPTKQLAGVLCFKPHAITKIGTHCMYSIYFDPSVTDYSLMLNTANCGNCRFSDLQLKGCYNHFLLRKNIRNAIKQMDEGTMPYINLDNPSDVALMSIYTRKMSNMRYGESGDPCSVPMWAHNKLDSFMVRFKNRTGYTHQWREVPYQSYKVLIASVDSAMDIAELKQIAGNDAKYARVLPSEGAMLLSNERKCPQQMGIIESCTDCGLCQKDKAPNIKIVFIPHGTTGIAKAMTKICGLSLECGGCDKN